MLQEKIKDLRALHGTTEVRSINLASIINMRYPSYILKQISHLFLDFVIRIHVIVTKKITEKMGSAILRYDFIKNIFSYDSPVFGG